MTETTTQRRSAPLAAAGLFLIGAFVFLAGAALLAPTKPAVIAAVDLEKVYDGLEEQKAADAGCSAPQLGQVWCSGEPQELQKRASAGLSVPQEAQVSATRRVYDAETSASRRAVRGATRQAPRRAR